jgi:hypothetical protein
MSLNDIQDNQSVEVGAVNTIFRKYPNGRLNDE